MSFNEGKFQPIIIIIFDSFHSLYLEQETAGVDLKLVICLIDA